MKVLNASQIKIQPLKFFRFAELRRMAPCLTLTLYYEMG